VRGHFWFDGNVLWMFDGAAWTAVGGSAAASGGASVAIGTTPPTAPQPGALWFDGAMLLLWTGTAWVPTEGNATGASPPANPSDGMLWWNGSTLMVWDGNAWVPVSQTKSYIQATAPPSPNVGDTWWNGTQMRIWDGTAWNLVGPGATVGPVATTTNVFKLADPSGTGNVSGTAWQIVAPTTTPAIDTMTGWDSITHRYIPKLPGMYSFFCMGYCNLTAGTYGSLALVKNDSGTFASASQDNVAITSIGIGTGSLTTWLDISGMRYMNGTTDFVRLWAQAGTSVQFGLNGQTPMIDIFLSP
jgi:hypothetical protein